MRLLDAALELVWRDGYGAVTVDMICRRAGVLAGTFYHFFPGKAELVAETTTRYWEQAKALFPATPAPGRTALQQLTDHFDHLYRRSLLHRASVGRVLGGPITTLGSEVGPRIPSIAAIVSRVQAEHLSHVRDLLMAAGIERGEQRTADEWSAEARLVMTHFTGVLTAARIHDDLSIIRESARTVCRLLRWPEPPLPEPAPPMDPAPEYGPQESSAAAAAG